jgi:hypothetical protein
MSNENGCESVRDVRLKLLLHDRPVHHPSLRIAQGFEHPLTQYLLQQTSWTIDTRSVPHQEGSSGRVYAPAHRAQARRALSETATALKMISEMKEHDSPVHARHLAQLIRPGGSSARAC